MPLKGNTSNPRLNPMAISITDEKKIIIHNVLTALIFTGVVLNFITIIRDIDMGVNIMNAIINSSVLVIVILILLFGKRLHHEIKSWIFITICGFIGSKVILVNGVISGTFYFFVLAALIALLIFKRPVALLLIILISALYIILSSMMAFRILRPTIDVAQTNLTIKWLGDLCSYALVLFIVIGGVGRMQRTLIRSIEEQDETNQKLNQSNEELLNQLEHIRAMQKKVEQTEINFQRLFQESNDGILLCNGEGVIIEANNSISTMLEYPKTYLVGNKASAFVIADDKRAIDQLSIEKIHRAKIREMHVVTQHGARIPVEINYSPISMNDETVLLVTVRDIRERKQTEQKVLNAVIQAEENERSRFAKDLHDDLGPILSSIKMYIQSLRTHEDSEDKKELINRLVFTVDDSIKSIRRISYNLSSHLLQNMGLINALNTHAERINLTDSLKIAINHNFPESHRLASNIEIVVYRVVLELITNSIKHSQGTTVTIDLQLKDDQLMVNYSDNGIGFDIDRMLHDNTKGIGLKNILSRVRSIKGLLNFETQKSGFNLSVDITL